MYRLRNPKLVQEAIAKWELVDLGVKAKMLIPMEPIPYTVKDQEARWIQSLLVHNHGIETPSILLQKIACVLRWENTILGRKDDTVAVLKEFAPSLGESGGVVGI